MQPRDVAAEGAFIVQIDVEANEIGEVDRQIFGRRKIRVADQSPRMLSSDAADEVAQKSAHPLGAVPADHVGRDFVADEIGEDCRMAVAGANPGDYRLSDY